MLGLVLEAKRAEAKALRSTKSRTGVRFRDPGTQLAHMTNKRVRYRVIAGVGSVLDQLVAKGDRVLRRHEVGQKEIYTPEPGVPHMVYDIGIVRPQELLGHEIIYYLVMPKILNRLLALVAAAVFPLVHATLDLPDPARFAIALALVGACGLPLGLPLALGVRRLGRDDVRSVAWAWGVNGAASVVGACAVMIVMVFVGSRTALIGAVACYAVSAAAGATWPRAATPR